MGVNHVATSPDNSLAALGCGTIWYAENEMVLDPIARIFRVSDGQLLTSLGHASPVRYVQFSPDGSKLITGTRNGIRVYNTATWTFTSIPAPMDFITTDLPSAKAATAQGTVVKVWDLATGSMIHQFTSHVYRVQKLSFSGNGSILGSASFVDHDGPSEIRFWRMSDGLQTHLIDAGIGAGVKGFDVAPDGQSYIFSKLDIGVTRAALP
jgi:glucose repression regulatory protein TUP1